MLMDLFLPHPDPGGMQAIYPSPVQNMQNQCSTILIITKGDQR